MSKASTVILTEEMIEAARALISATRVRRTVASGIDTLTGILGEFAFAEYFYNDWRQNRVGENKGEVDFEGIEIKASAFPFSDRLNLLVREDYAQKRKPAFYVQIILDVPSRHADTIFPGTKALVCGWATAEEVDRAPKRDFGSKMGGRGGYSCHYIRISALHPMEAFRRKTLERGEKR
ncbi:MAG: hypothetical protein J7M27_13955 [Candidatus Latescibacteria bacterium]|nr:hypothetical protein [Candidatus Latescibacterota bacterium]